MAGALISTSTTVSVGGNVGWSGEWKEEINKHNQESYNTWAASFGGGMNFSGAENKRKLNLIDINGDGLPDLLRRDGTTLKVRLNNGAGFGNEINWTGGMPACAWNNSITAAINGHGTGGFTIPLLALYLKISATVSLNAGLSLNGEHIQIMDIDGDGYADILQSPSKKELNVYSSNIGKTGLLKSVTNPLGGSFEINYKKTEATPSHSRRWVMNSVQIKDNFPGDGVDVMRMDLEYEKGYYDRKERSFYGFAKVTETQSSRKVVRYYYNDNIAKKGLLAAEAILDGDNLFVYSMNSYQLISRQENSESKFPALTQTITCYYEGTGSVGSRHVQQYQYDKYGNVERKTESSNNMDDVILDITYHENTTKYIVGIPCTVKINGFRQRITSIDGNGRITAINDYVNSSTPLTTEMGYDDYGNCTSIYYPDHFILCLYDRHINTYPTSVTDAFYNTSFLDDYDFRFGTPRHIVDKSGNPMKYELDKFGRIVTIKGPKEIEAEKDYSIRYEYIRGDLTVSPKVPYASRTYNYDPSNPGNDIEVYTYVDGLGRVIQTKKDAESAPSPARPGRTEAMIISGKVYYDALGRAISTKYPTYELKGNTLYSTSEDNLGSTSTYDIMDRPLIQTAADNSTVTYTYDFETINNISFFRTTVTDQKGNTSKVLKNTQGLQYLLKASEQPPVFFEYNTMGECTRVYGENDFSRSYTYDWLGRKESYTEDQLEEIYTYNKTNLVGVKKIWHDIQLGDTTSKTITYAYKNNRLDSVKSSEYSKAIKYHYNNWGKLASINDESGIQSFEYGSMGEVTQMTRIYSLPGISNTIAVTTGFEYDSWGRMSKLSYPDGENVFYHYDYGGQLKTIQGEKAGEEYVYLNNTFYDKFGAKTKVVYGNGVTTSNRYDSQSLRLTSQTVSPGSMSSAMPGQVWTLPINGTSDYLSATYAYDSKGNITSINCRYGGKNDIRVNQTFEYDASDQLIQATGNNGNLYNLTVSYNAFGRINSYDNTMTDPQTNVVTQIQNNFTYPTGSAVTSTVFAPLRGNSNTTFEFGINGSLRKKVSQEKTEYYLFNAFDQMKAYSDNGESYGYYGYDAGGERTYKISLTKSINEASKVGGEILEVEKLTMYPNGYINIDQFGNYTKHYYAEDQRIASKIGGGYSGNICQSLVASDPIEVVIKELGEVSNDTIDVISYKSTILGTLQGDDTTAFESGLYFYHGNHLSSTQVITDFAGKITQQVLYAPFGEVITEYKADWHNGTMPDYMFNGKELDDESGMYYYSQRYYVPPMFTSRDELFEKYFWMSPYNYCLNNPVKHVDPDGRGPIDRVQAARNMTGIPYKNEAGKLRVENTATGTAYMDCSEFVCRVLAADQVTDGVQNMNSAALRKYFETSGDFTHSNDNPQVGDIAVWEGHVGIVSEVGKNGKIKLIHARGVGKDSKENGTSILPKQYKDSKFYGYYRPTNETPDGKLDDAGNSNQSNAPSNSTSNQTYLDVGRPQKRSEKLMNTNSPLKSLAGKLLELLGY